MTRCLAIVEANDEPTDWTEDLSRIRSLLRRGLAQESGALSLWETEAATGETPWWLRLFTGSPVLQSTWVHLTLSWHGTAAALMFPTPDSEKERWVEASSPAPASNQIRKSLSGHFGEPHRLLELRYCITKSVAISTVDRYLTDWKVPQSAER